MGIYPTTKKGNCYGYLWNLGMWIVIFADIAKKEK